MVRVITSIYDIGGYRIYHGDCLTLDIEPVDVMITDPPFAPKTHSNARTNKGRQKGGSDLVDFAPLEYDGLAKRLEHLVQFVKTWAVFTCEWTYAARLDKNPPSGWEFVRCGIWTKPDGAPQITGDRPGQGWEAIVFLHRLNDKGKPGRKKWNGGGRSSVFHHGVCHNALYPTQKPVTLISDFVRLFTNPGDTILDPFCGSGTTLHVAKQLGRKAIGCDISEKACRLAESRLAQEILVI